jgi:immune inhibitor A
MGAGSTHVPFEHLGGRQSPSFCAVAPHPRLRESLRERLPEIAASGPPLALRPEPRRPGFNDGTLRPPAQFPIGATARDVRRAAAQRAPLRGTVRVAVVLAEFSDRRFGAQASRFEDLFFSTGVVPTGSVAEYFREVAGGLIEIAGQVVGPLTMPQTLAWYANSNYGIGEPAGEARAPVLALDAAKAANAVLDFSPYDNDGDGYVDAYVVVHAGRGGEETGHSGDIWSHKWVLEQEYAADSATVYAYLTIPEDAKLGVSAHELGHLLFGFPDLYDTDQTSEGVGSWCLMGSGSWNNDGHTPAHPSAWCKVQQGWADVVNITGDGRVDVEDVKASRRVYRAWTHGAEAPESFLLENRQHADFDTHLPGAGLLLWHVDDSQPDNTDESHYLVGLVQADGLRELEQGASRGDAGDCFPGWSDVRVVDETTTPSTTTYAGQDSLVRLRDISDSGATMSLAVSVTGAEGGGDDGGGPGQAALEAQVRELQERLGALEQRVTALEAPPQPGPEPADDATRRWAPWSRQRPI